MSIFSQNAQVMALQCVFDTKTLHAFLIDATTAAAITDTSTVADAEAGEIGGGDIARVLVNDHTGTPLTAAWSSANSRAEATVTLSFENTSTTTAYTYASVVVIYDGSITVGNTTGTIFVTRTPLVSPETINPENTRNIGATIFLND